MMKTQDWIIVETKTGKVQGKLSYDVEPNVQMDLMMSGYETYPEDYFNKFGLDGCREMYDIDLSEF